MSCYEKYIYKIHLYLTLHCLDSRNMDEVHVLLFLCYFLQFIILDIYIILCIHLRNDISYIYIQLFTVSSVPHCYISIYLY